MVSFVDPEELDNLGLVGIDDRESAQADEIYGEHDDCRRYAVAACGPDRPNKREYRQDGDDRQQRHHHPAGERLELFLLQHELLLLLTSK
jgi:hypothetical protein